MPPSALASVAPWRRSATSRYSCSLIANHALIGWTCDTVVSTLVGETRLPICTSVMPTMSVDQRADVGEAEVQLGLTHGAARRLDGRLGRAVELDVVVELALRNRPRLGERAIALDVSRRASLIRDALP